MNKVSGQIQAGEAISTAAAIQKRQRGPRALFLALYAGFMIFGGVVGFGLVSLCDRLTKFDYWSSILMFVGIVIGAVGYILLCRPMLVSRFRTNMEVRSLPSTFTQVTEITDAGLRVGALGVESVAEWTAVTEVFRSKNYWIFLVAMQAWCIPARFFSSADDEGAFLRSALERMTLEARKRSAEAVAVAQL